MTAQVVYLNVWHNGTFYQISDDEMRKRLKLQAEMEIFQAEIEYQSRDFNEFQKSIYKEQSHNNLRMTWELIKETE